MFIPLNSLVRLVIFNSQDIKCKNSSLFLKEKLESISKVMWIGW